MTAWAWDDLCIRCGLGRQRRVSRSESLLIWRIINTIGVCNQVVGTAWPGQWHDAGKALILSSNATSACPVPSPAKTSVLLMM